MCKHLKRFTLCKKYIYNVCDTLGFIQISRILTSKKVITGRDIILFQHVYSLHTAHKPAVQTNEHWLTLNWSWPFGVFFNFISQSFTKFVWRGVLSFYRYWQFDELKHDDELRPFFLRPNINSEYTLCVFIQGLVVIKVVKIPAKMTKTEKYYNLFFEIWLNQTKCDKEEMKKIVFIVGQCDSVVASSYEEKDSIVAFRSWTVLVTSGADMLANSLLMTVENKHWTHQNLTLARHWILCIEMWSEVIKKYLLAFGLGLALIRRHQY